MYCKRIKWLNCNKEWEPGTVLNQGNVNRLGTCRRERPLMAPLLPLPCSIFFLSFGWVEGRQKPYFSNFTWGLSQLMLSCTLSRRASRCLQSEGGRCADSSDTPKGHPHCTVLWHREQMGFPHCCSHLEWSPRKTQVH